MNRPFLDDPHSRRRRNEERSADATRTLIGIKRSSSLPQEAGKAAATEIHAAICAATGAVQALGTSGAPLKQAAARLEWPLNEAQVNARLRPSVQCANSPFAIIR
jgi:hypothetical protein